jgi:hypothetical protein
MHRTRRGMAAAIVLLALFMQLIAPYLPMPAMGGLTSVQLSAMPICHGLQHDEDGQTQKHRPRGEHCPICVVVAQAGSTLAPAPIVVATSQLAACIENVAAPQAQPLSTRSSLFSSRAPPLSV